MRQNHPKSANIPRLWLFTDERVEADAIVRAAGRLPRGAGIVFRHYALRPALRRSLFDRIRKVARRRGLMLLLAGTPHMARTWGANGVHMHGTPVQGLGRLHLSCPAHDVHELRKAARADLIFLSPVFATRSHPGARPLGRNAFVRLACLSRAPVIALGGMNRTRCASLAHAHGWAAIDALTGN